MGSPFYCTQRHRVLQHSLLKIVNSFLEKESPLLLFFPTTNRYFTVISSLCQFSFVNISYKTQAIFLCKLTIQGRFKVSFIRLPPAAFRRFPSLEAKRRSTLPCFPAPAFSMIAFIIAFLSQFLTTIRSSLFRLQGKSRGTAPLSACRFPLHE